MAGFEDLSPQDQSLLKAARSLFGNPDVSESAKRLLMKADKNVRFPELEQRDAVEGELSKRDKKIEEVEHKLMQTEAEQRLRERRQQAIDAGLDPAEVEKAIVDKGISKWETAMEFVRMGQQAAVPTAANVHDHSMRLPGTKEDGLWKDPTKYARDAAHQMIDQMRGRRSA